MGFLEEQIPDPNIHFNTVLVRDKINNYCSVKGFMGIKHSLNKRRWNSPEMTVDKLVFKHNPDGLSNNDLLIKFFKDEFNMDLPVSYLEDNPTLDVITKRIFFKVNHDIVTENINTYYLEINYGHYMDSNARNLVKFLLILVDKKDSFKYFKNLDMMAPYPIEGTDRYQYGDYVHTDKEVNWDAIHGMCKEYFDPWPNYHLGLVKRLNGVVNLDDYADVAFKIKD